MRKAFYLLLVVIFCFTKPANAQRDSVVAYMKSYHTASWLEAVTKIVDTKDSADFVRMVTSPDADIDKNLFPVTDYYLNGKPKLKAFSTTGSIEGVFQGSYIAFFPNGKRKLICSYDKGKRNGEVYEYFPNGKLYLSGTFKNDTLSVQSCTDSTGKVLAENGNGMWIRYTDDFTRTIDQGPVKNGLKEGEWKGVLNDTLSYTALMKANKVVEGVSVTKRGNKYPFTKEFVAPGFTGGLEKFAQYLAKAIHYPEYARDHKIQGKALLMFNVDIHGNLYSIHPISGNELLVNEAMRVVKLSPPWVPATSYGVPVETVYSVPISFSLAYVGN